MSKCRQHEQVAILLVIVNSEQFPGAPGKRIFVLGDVIGLYRTNTKATNFSDISSDADKRITQFHVLLKSNTTYYT